MAEAHKKMVRNPYGRWAKGTRWATLFDACTRCSTTEQKHYGNGLCKKCHQDTNEGYKASVKKYRASGKWKETKRKYDLRIRIEALRHYSKGKPKCKCCGENDYRFLAFDHINGGGRKHYKEIKHVRIAHWLKKNNYPDGFQILCHNCNMAKSIYKQCPHKLPKA